MKKIFTFLCLLMLGAGMSAWAQETPSNRKNAPMLAYNESFTWSDEVLSYHVNRSGTATNTAVQIDWYSGGTAGNRPCLRLIFMIPDDKLVTIGNKYYPCNGTYTITNTDADMTANTYWFYNQSAYYCMGYDDNGKWTLASGTIEVSDGGDATGKPYIVVNATSSGGNPITATIGEPKPVVQYTISVAKTPAAGGTVTGGGTLNSGATTTIVATPDYVNGYVFEKWQKDGVDFDGNTATSITLTASSDTKGTYTAKFKQATDGTIAGLSDNDSYGSVIVNQPSTAGGTAVTLTPVANDGYAFSQWTDGNTDNPRTVYVDGDAEYTAQFVFGVAIDVQAAMTGNSGYDDYTYKYWAKTKDYDIHIIGNGGTYTENDDFDISSVNTSASRIIDHGVTVTLTNDFEGYFHTVNGKQVLDATVTGSNGKKYILTLRGKNVGDGNLSVGYSNNFDQTYSSMSVKSDKGNGIWRISGQNGTGETYSTTWCSHFFFATDQNKCGDVPSGYYQVDDNGSVGTLITTDNSSNQSYGSYYVQSYVYYDLATGYAEVVNRDETYYIRFEGYHYRGYTHTAQIGTTPYTLNATASANGHTNLVWHSANCGDVTYTAAEMPQKFFNGNTVTFNAVANEGYEFWRWSDEDESVETSAYGSSRNVTVSGNLTLQAIFREAAATHTVTFNDYDDSQIQTGNVEENTQPTIAADPTRADDLENHTVYTFVGWKSSVDDQIYTTENLPVATTEVTYTAQYEPYFLLLDDKTDNNDAYYTALANKEGERLNVKYMRTFTAGRWATFSLPFGYSYRPEENTTFKGQVYYLISAKYTADGYLTLNCMPVTDGLVANKPYILIPSATIENPTFKNVKMKAVAPNYYTAPNTEGIGTGVEFRNTIERETLEKDKRVIYIKGANNQLYYPSMSVDTWMRPFRGYFYLNVTPEQIPYTPARVRLVTPEGEYIEQAPDTDQPATVETKKYIENGILIIERAGMKYDAQGHIIK